MTYSCALIMNFRDLGYGPCYPREVEHVAIDRVAWFPDSGELGLVVQQSLIAEKEIKLLHEVMDSPFLSGRLFMLSKSGHGSHSQAESLISLGFHSQKKLDEKVIHHAGGGNQANAASNQ